MSLRYEVVAGPGVVTRVGESLLWVGDDTDPAAWDALRAALRLEPGQDPGGADLAPRLDEVQRALQEHPSTAFAALLVSGDRAQGLLRGPVTVRNQTDVAPATGHGQLGITVPFAMSEAVYVGFGQPAAPHSLRERFDFAPGVVPGAGAWAHPVSAPAQASAGEGAGSATAGAPAASDATGPQHAASEQPGDDSQGIPAPAFTPAVAAAAPAVGVPDLGVPDASVGAHAETDEPQATPNTGGHPVQPQPLPEVSPTGSWASAAGTGAPADAAEAPAAHAADGFVPADDHAVIDLRHVQPDSQPVPLPINEPRPQAQATGPAASLGAIVFDDGSTFALDRDYVVGRRPEKDPRVQSGQATALTVVDPDTVLSSAHALLAIRGTQVVLTDLGSLNGTHVAAPGAQDWSRLEQYQEVIIAPGTRLLFGWTVATYSGGS